MSNRLVSALALFCSSCLGIPNPSATPEQVAALRRQGYPVVPGPNDARVSALASEPLALPRIVYVHGTPGSGSCWVDYLVDPVAGCESVAIDRPGFGETGGAARSSLQTQGDAVAAASTQGPFSVLVGHSLGGPVVLRAAADHPERVQGVVVVAGSVDPDLESLRWYNWLGWPFEPVLPRALRHGNREIRGLKPELIRLREVLGQVRCPVTIVHGRQDSLVPYANVDFMVRSLTNAASVDVVTLDDADHFLIWREQHEPIVREAIEQAVARGRRYVPHAPRAD